MISAPSASVTSIRKNRSATLEFIMIPPVIACNLYFDNAAAVPVKDSVLARFTEISRHFFANQEASGAHAAVVRKALQKAVEDILTSLQAPTDSALLWTDSGTCAIQAVFQLLPLLHPAGGTILLSAAEHAAVGAAAAALPQQFRLCRVNLTPSGQLDAGDFASKLTPETILAAVPFVQSETGVIQNVPLFRKLLSSAAPEAMLFCDAVQGLGKVPFEWRKAAPDLLTFSGQKLGVPGGGGVIARSSLRLPLLSLRSKYHRIGRVPPAMCLLLAEVLKLRIENLPACEAHIRQMNYYLRDSLNRLLQGKFTFTVPDDTPVSPYILHTLWRGYQGAVLTRSLALKGVSVAPGSACNAEDPEPSQVLQAMKISRRDAYSALRISLMPDHTEHDIDQLCRLLAEVISEY